MERVAVCEKRINCWRLIKILTALNGNNNTFITGYKSGGHGNVQPVLEVVKVFSTIIREMTCSIKYTARTAPTQQMILLFIT